MSTLTLGYREFHALVSPIVPLAGRDGDLPIINALLIETDGKWLSATATDRFRLGIKRIEKQPTDDDPATEWPTFRALIPLRAVKSLLATFKPRRGTLDPTLNLTVDGDRLTAEAAGLFDLFDSGRFVHTLQPGEYPNVRGLVKKALDVKVEDRVSSIGINPAYLADFKACGSTTLRMLIGTAKTPLVVTDDEGFIGALMPRPLFAGDDVPEDWADFLAPKPEPESAPKKRAARKPKVGAA